MSKLTKLQAEELIIKGKQYGIKIEDMEKLNEAELVKLIEDKEKDILKQLKQRAIAEGVQITGLENIEQLAERLNNYAKQQVKNYIIGIEKKHKLNFNDRFILIAKKATIIEPATQQEQQLYQAGEWDAKRDLFIGKNYKGADTTIILVEDANSALFFKDTNSAMAYGRFVKMNNGLDCVVKKVKFI